MKYCTNCGRQLADDEAVSYTHLRLWSRQKGQKLMERTIWEAEPCLALPQSSMQSL